MAISVPTRLWSVVSHFRLIEIVSYLTLASIIFVLSVIAYRFTLHPLAKYPGNFIEKISDWPLITYCMGGERHLCILEAHDKYGSVVRIGPNTLSFNTVEALEAIHFNRKANVKRAAWYKTIDAGSGDYSTQSVLDKKEHAFRRRVLSHAFSEKKASKSDGRNVGEDGWTETKEFSIWATFYGFDFTGDLAFGQSFGMIEDEENRYLPNMLMGTSWFLYFAGYLPFAWILRLVLSSPLMIYLPGKAAQDSFRFFQLAQNRLASRFKLEEDAELKGKKLRPDIFHYILKGRDPETGLGFTRDQLNADAGLLIAAGSDGVGITLSAALFYILKNPEVLETLTREIRTTFTSPDDIGGQKLTRLPYLQAVVEETLRISPPVPSLLPREVEAGGLDIDTLHIPEGIDVGVPHYAIHHNESYYPDSFSFKPSRWLGSNAETALAKRAFCAFSRGAMDCIGQRVAYLAVKLALARLIWVYDIRAANGGNVSGGEKRRRGREGEYQMVDWLVGYRSGPDVQFKARKID